MGGIPTRIEHDWTMRQSARILTGALWTCGPNLSGRIHSMFGLFHPSSIRMHKFNRCMCMYHHLSSFIRSNRSKSVSRIYQQTCGPRRRKLFGILQFFTMATLKSVAGILMKLPAIVETFPETIMLLPCIPKSRNWSCLMATHNFVVAHFQGTQNLVIRQDPLQLCWERKLEPTTNMYECIARLEAQ